MFILDILKVYLFSTLSDALDRYYTLNGQNPKKIIFYRQGVADDEENMVEEIEIPQIKNALDDASGGVKIG